MPAPPPPPSAITWEQALTTLVGPSTPLPDRYAAADLTKNNWMTSHKVESVDPQYIDKKSLEQRYSFWWVSSGPISSDNYYYVVAGAVGNWDEWDRDRAGSKYLQFDLNPGPLLDVLRHSPNQNAYASLPSFTAASQMIANLGNWIPALQKTINGWTDNIDVPDSDLQGSAAGKFKEYLESYSKDLGDLWFNVCGFNPPAVGGQSELEKALEAAGAAVVTAAQALWDAWNNWRMAPDGLAYPAFCLTKALGDLLTAGVTVATGTSTTPYTSGGQDLQSDAFWKTVELNGKTIWQNNLTTALDVPARNAFGALAAALQAVDALLPTISPQTPGVSQPTPPGGTAPPPPGGTAPPPPGGGTAPPPPGAGGGAHTPPPPGSHLPPPPTTNHVNGGSGNGFAPPPSTGGNVPLLGPDGKPLTDKNGKPLTAPAGSKIGPHGEVIGPDGKPVLGPDGKPEHVPKGGSLGTISPGFIPFSVPPGSTLNADGTVNGPDGKALLDRSGNKVYLGKNARIDKDGKVLDANGKPISEQTQFLSDEEYALSQMPLNPASGLTGNSGYTGYTGGSYWPGSGSHSSNPSSSGYTGESYEPNLGTGSGGLRLGGTSGLSLGDGIPSGSGVPTVGGALKGTTGVGERGLAQARGLPAGEAAAGEAAAAELAARERASAGLAAEEAQMMGRSVATTGGGGMPPMMPPGGAGGGGAPAGQERQRTTWLAEDEEVWGTETGAVGGVIGR